jgi:predicted AlkP superfamily pyrophosphatase or phosphodiesterase
MDPLIPDYEGACLSNVVPTLLDRPTSRPAWFPAPVWEAERVVLLALDGLGWDQLEERRDLAPTITGLTGQSISTVAPSTTATALSSLTLGCAPGEHGVVGYRIAVDGDVLNVLRWQTPEGDARERIPPESIQQRPPFCGQQPPVVTRTEFAGTGFTTAHLGGTRLAGWRMASTLVTEVGRLLGEGEPFVYAYYDGIDKVAHEYGLADHYDAELAAADRLVADLLAVMPAGVALLVTSDHGQVQVGDAVVPIAAEVMSHVALLSGEGRFRWLHATRGHEDELEAASRAAHGDRAWVRTRQQVLDEGWFGLKVTDAAVDRLGDVVLAAIDDVAFEDPADTGPYRLQSRHGSLTSAEMCIPLLGGWA